MTPLCEHPNPDECPNHGRRPATTVLQKCIADAEEALNSGALAAAELGEDHVRRALVSTRSHLRKQLGEGAA